MVADLICSSGCSCCRDDEVWYATIEKFAKALGVPKYEDGSGRNFTKFRSPNSK